MCSLFSYDCFLSEGFHWLGYPAILGASYLLLMHYFPCRELVCFGGSLCFIAALAPALPWLYPFVMLCPGLPGHLMVCIGFWLHPLSIPGHGLPIWLGSGQVCLVLLSHFVLVDVSTLWVGWGAKLSQVLSVPLVCNFYNGMQWLLEASWRSPVSVYEVDLKLLSFLFNLCLFICFDYVCCLSISTFVNCHYAGSLHWKRVFAGSWRLFSVTLLFCPLDPPALPFLLAYIYTVYIIFLTVLTNGIQE